MSQKCALIIDDDAANRAIWELVLTDKGYTVFTAGDLKEGQDQVSDAITLYLVDYHLPDGKGTEIVRQLRGYYPGSLVIMVSMDDDSDVIKEGIRSGGNIFMVKPTSPSVMSQILEEIEAGVLKSNARQLISRHGRRTYS